MNEELLKTIELPEGFVIDKDKSTDTKIVIKAVVEEKVECKTYEEIQAYNKMKGKLQFYSNYDGIVRQVVIRDGIAIDVCRNNVPSKEIAEKIIALCQLYIIAEYYNDGWVPDWDGINSCKYYAMYDVDVDRMLFRSTWSLGTISPAFKSMETIEEAYKHNKEIFKKVLSI